MTKKKVTKGLIKLNKKDKNLLSILLDNKEGLRTLTIQKLSNMPSKTLYRHLNKLKDLEIIEKYSTIWKICHSQTNTQKVTKLLQSSIIQVHDISFVVKLIRTPDWWAKRENNLRRLKEYQFKKNVEWGNNPYTQLLKDNFLIHCFKNSLVFINKKKYFGKDPYNCFIESLNDFLEALRYFEERIKFKLFLDNVPQISIKSSHFVKLKDYLNKRCKKRGDEFEVFVNGERRAWVDFSYPNGTEFGNKDYGPEDTKRYVKIVEDVIKNNPPTLSEINNNFKEVEEMLKKSSELQIGQAQVINQIEKNLLHLSKVVYEIGGKKE